MSDLLASVGDDFEAFYPDVTYVTVQLIDGVTGAVLNSADQVAAAKTIDKRGTVPARSGSVTTRGQEWWVRVDRLGFELRTQCRIVEPGGTTWIIDEVSEIAGALARCPLTKKR